MSNSEHIVYTSFDRVPSPKGAAVHIRQFVRALGKEFGDVDLVTPEPGAMAPEVEEGRWPGVTHHRLPAVGTNVITRAMAFRTELSRYWSRPAEVVQFRSIFEGYPLALHKERVARRLVFEVNGLPSIELKYHHPDVADDRELLRKLRHQEDACLAAADLVVTPSGVTQDYLVTRGVEPGRIEVIPNGVDLDVFPCRSPEQTSVPRGEGPLRILYSGTLSAWQGVRQAIEALGLYRRDFPAALTVVAPVRGKQRDQLAAWCQAAGVADAVELVPPMSQLELAALHHQHDVVVAPLLANDRNTLQGCCPLKVLEAMASGVPVVASDLPVVRALARSEVEALLVRPGSSKAIKDGLLRLRADPELGARLASAARARVEQRFTWSRSNRSLVAAYRRLLDEEPATLSRSARSADTSLAD